MGNWAIVVNGHGIHDNGRDDDADAMTAQFADELRARGHVLSSVTFTAGYAKELAPVPEDGPGNPGAGWKTLA